VAQASSVRRPHSTEPPSSTDHSKDASPNSLIGLLALVIFLEKVIPRVRIAYVGGVIFVAAGAWLLSTAMF
jgi:hypothetical protein